MRDKNIHTYDFGLIDLPCSLTATVLASACDAITDTYSATVVAVILNNAGTDTLSISSDGVTRTFPTSIGSSTSFTTVFSGMVPDGLSHTVLVSQPDCGFILLTYLAPLACQPRLTLRKFTNKTVAQVGDSIIYSLVLTNVGSASTATTVRDSLGSGLTYVNASATIPAGTSFAPGQPISLWNVPAIAAGQSLTLTFQVRVDSVGVVSNTAMIPGDTATVCTSVPIRICAGSSYVLTVPAGRPSYQWYKDGVLLQGQISNTLVVTAPGSYSVDAGAAGGLCAGFSCCPFIVEENALPAFLAQAVPVTCSGATPQANGQIILSTFTAGQTYQYSAGAVFDPSASLSGTAQIIPATGVLVATLPNPVVDALYTIRVYASSGCYADKTVTLLPTVCTCPEPVCVPFVINRIEPLRRIGRRVR